VKKILKNLNLKKFIQPLKEFLGLTLISTGTIVMVFWFVGQPLEISGDSMLPNFESGEQVIAEKLSLYNVKPVRGEVMILKHPDYNLVFLIKRIIGLPGDKIRIQNGLVFINDKQLLEPYLNKETKTTEREFLQEDAEYTLASDEYFSMGDNRGESVDSRTWGPTKYEDLVGRPIVVYLPLHNFRLVERH
jgi:signal peptidase I